MRYIGNTPKLPEFGKIKSEKLFNVSLLCLKKQS